MNAIILAAGMGTRLRPLTDALPKALVKVGAESFFERQVRMLKSSGVEDITVVTGYRAEAFDPWRSEAGLRFIQNDRYQDWNNLFSMHLAREHLGDTIVLDGDVWIGEGVLPSASPGSSRWFVGYREGMTREWAVRCDRADRVERIDVCSGRGWILTGVSYWTRADGAFIASRIGTMMEYPSAPELFWDDAPRASLDTIAVYAQRIGPNDWAEVDTVDELAALSRAVMS